jgi:putative endonuclease
VNTKGAAYEEQAAVFLRAAGYRIVDRNWACPMGELDIVALKGDTLAFVEVRQRSGSAYGTPAESVTRSKQAKIVKAAQAYLKARRPDAENFRFDVIAIIPGAEPEHIEGAFDAGPGGF